MKNEAAPDYWRDRTIFPTTIPNEVKFLIKNISNIEKSFFRKMIRVALGYLQQIVPYKECEIAFENLCKLKHCSSEKDVMELSILYSGIISLLRGVLKVNLKTVRQDTLVNDLIELGIPQDFSSDICKVVFGPLHNEIFSNIVENNPHILKIEEINWNVEPTLASSISGKIIEPTIVMTLKSSSNKIHEFEVPILAFHQLRHCTASILRHMEVLQRKK